MVHPTGLSEPGSATGGLAVSLRAVTKVYDNGVKALGPLDLDVEKGEERPGPQSISRPG